MQPKTGTPHAPAQRRGHRSVNRPGPLPKPGGIDRWFGAVPAAPACCPKAPARSAGHAALGSFVDAFCPICLSAKEEQTPKVAPARTSASSDRATSPPGHVSLPRAHDRTSPPTRRAKNLPCGPIGGDRLCLPGWAGGDHSVSPPPQRHITAPRPATGRAAARRPADSASTAPVPSHAKEPRRSHRCPAARPPPHSPSGAERRRPRPPRRDRGPKRAAAKTCSDRTATPNSPNPRCINSRSSTTRSDFPFRVTPTPHPTSPSSRHMLLCHTPLPPLPLTALPTRLRHSCPTHTDMPPPRLRPLHITATAPDLSGLSRKGGPARSGGPPFLDKPRRTAKSGPQAGRRPVDV